MAPAIVNALAGKIRLMSLLDIIAISLLFSPDRVIAVGRRSI
jgi:hypothetical protein